MQNGETKIDKLKNLRIVTNFNCNQKCNYCYQCRYDKNYMDLDNLRYIFNQLDLEKQQFESVTIMGGEPTLNWNLWEIINFIKDKEITNNLNLDTNGSRLKSTEYIHLLDRITIDIGYPVKDDFWYNLKLLKEKLDLAQWLFHYFDAEVKFNLVYSDLNFKTFIDYFNVFLTMFEDIKEILGPENINFLITICEDFIRHKKVHMNRLPFKYNGFLKDIGLHLLEVYRQENNYIIGYFKKEDFRNTDLIIWQENESIRFTDDFEIYLKTVMNLKKGGGE